MSSSGSCSKVYKLKVATLGIYTDAIIPLGTAKGFFAKHCVSVSRTLVSNPAASLADLLGGSVDLAYSPSIPIVNAVGEGAPLRVVAPADGEPTTALQATAAYQKYGDLTGIYVKGSSPIKSPLDLIGKTVAVPALHAQLQVVASWLIKKMGGDPSKVNWVVLDFPTALAELDAGKIDAAGLTLPFSNQAIGHGDRLVAGSDVKFFGSGAAVGMWTTSASKLASEKTALLDFRAAVIETNAYADSHIKEFLPYDAKLSQVPLNIVSEDPPGDYFPTTVTSADLQRVANNIVYVGFLPKAPDFSNTIVP